MQQGIIMTSPMIFAHFLVQDATVSLSQLTATDIRRTRHFEDLHTDVVKSFLVLILLNYFSFNYCTCDGYAGVQFKNLGAQIFASCGNDQSVVVADTRRQAPVIFRISAAHSRAVNHGLLPYVALASVVPHESLIQFVGVLGGKITC